MLVRHDEAPPTGSSAPKTLSLGWSRRAMHSRMYRAIVYETSRLAPSSSHLEAMAGVWYARQCTATNVSHGAYHMQRRQCLRGYAVARPGYGSSAHHG